MMSQSCMYDVTDWQCMALQSCMDDGYHRSACMMVTIDQVRWYISES